MCETQWERSQTTDVTEMPREHYLMEFESLLLAATQPVVTFPPLPCRERLAHLDRRSGGTRFHFLRRLPGMFRPRLVIVCDFVHHRVITCVGLHIPMVPVLPSKARDVRSILADRAPVTSAFVHRSCRPGVESILVSVGCTYLAPLCSVESSVMACCGGARDTNNSNGMQFLTR